MGGLRPVGVGEVDDGLEWEDRDGEGCSESESGDSGSISLVKASRIVWIERIMLSWITERHEARSSVHALRVYRRRKSIAKGSAKANSTQGGKKQTLQSSALAALCLAKQ